MVSVIIPYYNVEGCIRRCIESVARQSWKDLEVLLIDDCSQDGTKTIVENFIKEYDGPISFRIIEQEKNQGQSAARNRGIEEAKGEYIYFLDSDDYISDDCIEILCREFEKDGNVQMVIGNYKIIGPLYLTPFQLQQRVHTSEEIIQEQLRFDIYTMPWNKLVRKDFLLRNNLLFQPGVVHEDNLWSFCSAFCFDKIAVVLKPTYYYMIRQGSTERSHNREWHQQQLFEVYKYLLKFIFLSDAPDKKNVKSLVEVFRYMQRDLIPFIMEPYVKGEKNRAFERYKEIRQLPYWTNDEVNRLQDITEKDRKGYTHFQFSVEKGFKKFVKQHKSYKVPKEMNTMKISVITVNYNNLSGLKRTLPSVFAQTYTGYELIVVDGGSTDGSKEYIQSQERIDQWVSEPDKGVYNAMNKAVKMAHGEYCIFMNSGDCFFTADVLETVVPKLQGKDFYTGCSTFIDGRETYTCYSPQKMEVDFLLVNSLNHQATFNRTDFLKENPYNESYRITADWGLFTRMWLQDLCTYECLPYMVAIYYMDGMSSVNKESANKERILQLSEMVTLPKLREKKKIKKIIDWYLALQDRTKTISFMESGTLSGRAFRHKRKLARRINDAMMLPPLQRDAKILFNALKMFFKDLF